MVDLQATSRAGEESRPSGRDECSAGQPVALARPGAALEVCLLQQALVLVRHQVGLALGDEVHHHHHHDQQRGAAEVERSEEHTSELQSLMRDSYAVFCLKTKKLRIILLLNFIFKNE